MGVEVAFQTALFTAINTAKATLGVYTVYDIQPQVGDAGSTAPDPPRSPGGIFPYIAMGRAFFVQKDTQTKAGFEVTARIHTHSRSGAFLECKTVQGKLYDLLHRSTLTVTGYNNFLLLRSDSNCFQDGGTTIHGVCEYVATIEET